jgi:hypothetical protein
MTIEAIPDEPKIVHESLTFLHVVPSNVAQASRTEGGAATAIAGLQIAEGAGAISFSVLTGGLGSGLLGAAGMAGLGAGGYAIAQATAGQASEKAHGLRDRIDWKDILKKGAEEAITNFTGALIGGALSKYFLRTLGERLLMRLGKTEIDALAARARLTALRMLRQKRSNFRRNLRPKSRIVAATRCRMRSRETCGGGAFLQT